MFKLRMRNNTDYPNWVVFNNEKDFTNFVDKYYKGEEGNLYWEQWQYNNGEEWKRFSEDFFLDSKKSMWLE